MSPFPHNPSPRLAADRPGLGLLPVELPLSVRCQLQSPPFLLTSLGRPPLRDQDKGEIFFSAGGTRILTVVIPP